MRPDLDRARRRRVVRDAARPWRSAGAIDDEALAAIDARYPEDRVRQRPIWRALIFVFVYVICSCIAGLATMMLRPAHDAAAVLAFLLGAALVGATELMQGTWRFDGTGAEAATSFLAVVSFIAGVAIQLLDRPHLPAAAIGATLAVAAVLWGTAGWRWGFPLYALLAAACAFFAVLELPGPVRIYWIAGGAAAAWIWSSLKDEKRLAPPQRDGCGFILAASLSAIYAAVNLYSFDHGFLEALRPGAARPATPQAARALSAIATALFPAAVLVLGWVRRRRVLVDLGLAFSALSLATVRAYVHLGPLWLVLGTAGIVLIAAAAFGERFLAREHFGWTAASLAGEDALAAHATTLAAAVVLSPDARPAAEPGFTPGGGRYGGGGASGDF